MRCWGTFFKLQLVLNSIFHVEASPEIAWEDYLDIREHPGISHALPIAVGDNFQATAVGTLPELLQNIEHHPGQKYAISSGGRWVDPQRRKP